MPLLALLFAVLPGVAPPGSAALIADADAAFFRIDYPAALASYERALEIEPASPEALWKLARLYVCMAEVATEPAQAACLVRAEEFARRCIHTDSTVADGYTWCAAALGYRALNAPAAEKFDLSWEMMAATDKALTLNPHDDGALSIRGSLYRALAGVGWLQRGLASLLFGEVPGGGFAEGEAALRQAMVLAPDVMRHPYELAGLYRDAGRMEEARRLLEHASSLPVRVAIDRKRLHTIRELLADPGLQEQ